jgi:hypothetical protein
MTRVHDLIVPSEQVPFPNVGEISGGLFRSGNGPVGRAGVKRVRPSHSGTIIARMGLNSLMDHPFV